MAFRVSVRARKAPCGETPPLPLPVARLTRGTIHRDVPIAGPVRDLAFRDLDGAGVRLDEVARGQHLHMGHGLDAVEDVVMVDLTRHSFFADMVDLMAYGLVDDRCKTSVNSAVSCLGAHSKRLTRETGFVVCSIRCVGPRTLKYLVGGRN